MNTYTATALGDRVAVRLDGAALVRAAHCVGRELPSEGLVRGAIQIPPDGLPVVMGPDHPTTGGYPVIAVVVDRDADRVMQLAPGAAVQFARTR